MFIKSADERKEIQKKIVQEAKNDLYILYIIYCTNNKFS